MKKIWEWFTNNFLSIISIFSPLIGAAIMAIWNAIANTFSVLDWVLMGLLIIQSIICISFALWRKFSFKSYHYPYVKIKPTYIVNKQEITYIVNHDGQLNFTNSRNIKSCIDHLQVIPCKFFWTGNKKANLPKNQIGCQFVLANSKGIWTFYDVRLADCLLRGQSTDIISEFNPIDDCTTSSPFVSATTEEPTKHINFHIELGDFVDGQVAKFEEYRSNEGMYPLKSKDITIEAGGKIDYIIKHPKRFRYYRISWNWKV